jgi:hypothetical protein
MWMQNFIETQGYTLSENVYYQNNQSAMRMEKNGRNSCTGNSRHIHIQYFFIKDQVDGGKLEIVYCPTGQMLVDYFIKPLQGKLFHLFCAVIMGWAHIDTIKDALNAPSSVPTERVENMGNSDEADKCR